jgi:ethanolamine utilization protein EutQ (cupin superfamily)
MTPEGKGTKAIGTPETNKENRRSSTLKVPKRAEVIVNIPMENGVENAEGLIEKTETAESVNLASSLVKIEKSQALTSILNTNETDIVVEIPKVNWENYEAEKREDSKLCRIRISRTQRRISK